MNDDRETPQAPAGMLSSIKGLVNDVIGPFALLAAGAQAFSSALSASVTEAKALQSALTASAGAEQLRRQFIQLGVSVGAANAKVKQLAELSSTSAFSFTALGNASRILQSIGGSAVNTTANIKKVMDVAAATGAPVENVAGSLSALYESLKRGGDGAASAAEQLARMGAISQDTAVQIAKFAAAGAHSSASLKLLEADLSKANGASVELAGTVVGLSNQLDGLKEDSDIKIGKMFEEGTKAGIRAQIQFQKVRDAMKEVAAQHIAPIKLAENSVLEGVGNVAASKPVVSAIKTGTSVLMDVAAGATLVGILYVSKLILDVLKGGTNASKWVGEKASKFHEEGMTRPDKIGDAYRIVADGIEKSGAGKFVARHSRGVRNLAGLPGRIAERSLGANLGALAGTAAGAARRLPMAAVRGAAGAGRFLASGFGGAATLAALDIEAVQGLYNQFENLTTERDAHEKESSSFQSNSSVRTLKNMRSAKLKTGSLTQSAFSDQLTLTGEESSAIKAKKEEIEEAKEKSKSHWHFGKYGDRVANMFTGVDNDNNSLKYKQDQLVEMETVHKQSMIALNFTRKQNASINGPLSSAQENAMNMSPDGYESRQKLNDAQISTLRVQQRFAPSSEARLKFKGEADDLEDKAWKGKRSLDLINSNVPADKADQIAEKEGQRNRILSNIDQAGVPEMSSMARMGGSAGFAGVVGGPNQDQTKNLDQIGKDLNELLSTVRAGNQMAEKIIKK